VRLFTDQTSHRTCEESGEFCDVVLNDFYFEYIYTVLSLLLPRHQIVIPPPPLAVQHHLVEPTQASAAAPCGRDDAPQTLPSQIDSEIWIDRIGIYSNNSIQTPDGPRCPRYLTQLSESLSDLHVIWRARDDMKLPPHTSQTHVPAFLSSFWYSGSSWLWLRVMQSPDIERCCSVCHLCVISFVPETQVFLIPLHP